MRLGIRLVLGCFLEFSVAFTVATAQASDPVAAARGWLAAPAPDAAGRWEWVSGARAAADALAQDDAQFELRLAVLRRALDELRPMAYADGEYELAYRIATLLGRRGRVDEELALLDDTLARPPSATYEPYLRAELTQLLRRAGELERAERELGFLDASVERAPGNHDPWRVQALIERIDLRLRLGQLERATEALDELDRTIERLAAAGALDPLDRRNALRKRWDVWLAAEEFRAVLADIEAVRAAPRAAVAPPASPVDNAVGEASGGESSERAAGGDVQPGAAPAFAADDGELRFYSGLARASLALGTGEGTNEARRELETLDAELDRPPLDRLHVEHALAWLAIERARFDEAERVLAHSAALLDEARAPTLERAQHAALLAALSLARGDAPAALAELEAQSEPLWRGLFDEWGRLPTGKSGWGSLHFASHRGVLAQWMRLAERAHATDGAERAFGALVHAQSRGSLAQSLGAAAPSLAEVRDVLSGPDHGLLVLVPSLDHTFVWTIDRVRFRSFVLPGVLRARPELERLREFASRALDADERTEARELGARVAAALLGAEACAELARWTRVSVIGGEFFGWLPIESFVLPGSELALGLTHAIDHWPSAPVALELARRARVAGGAGGAGALVGSSFGASAAANVERARSAPRLVLVAAPEPSAATRSRFPELVTLPFGERERQGVLGALGGSSTVLEGAHATRSALAAALGPDAGVLGFVAHGVHVRELERPTAIVLAPDTSGAADAEGWLDCDELESFPLPPIVELAVCGSLRGPARCGDDGPSHLAGAALRAGACAVLASRADLEYRSSLALVGAFHTELARGVDAAEALRRARVVVAERDEKSAAPWYFGAVQIFGFGGVRVVDERGAETTTPTRAADGSSVGRTITYAVAGAVAALAVGVFVRRRRAQPPPGGFEGGGPTGGTGRSV